MGFRTFSNSQKTELGRGHNFEAKIFSSFNIPAGVKIDLNVFDYQNTVIKDGANRISQIIDGSGLNNHALQSVQLEKPLLTLDAIGGKPGMEVTDSNDYLVFTNTLTQQGDFTIYYVVYNPSIITSSSGVLIFGGDITGIQPRMFIAAGNLHGVITGETLSIEHRASGVQRFSYIKDNIPAGVHVLKLKLSGSTTSIAIDGSEKTVFAHNGGLDPTHALDKLQTLSYAVAAPLFAYGRFLCWFRALTGDATSGEDGEMTNNLLNFWQ